LENQFAFMENPHCPPRRWDLLKRQLDNLSPQIFREQMGLEGIQLLDVRTREEFEKGHLVGARNLDYLGDGFLDELEALPHDHTYLVYCRTGRRSVRTCTLMRNAGFRKVYHLDGGLLAWEETFEPVTRT
jgi:rhodanese-related sulfurtransferase